MEGWGSFSTVQFVSPAARKMLLLLLSSRLGKSQLSRELSIPRSSLYLYLEPNGPSPPDDVTLRALDFALKSYPLEAKNIIRDSATYLVSSLSTYRYSVASAGLGKRLYRVVSLLLVLLTFVQYIVPILVDIAFSWWRMLAALFLSVVFSWAVGIAAAVNKTAEKVILPLLDVLQSVPILGFFPVMIYALLAVLPGKPGIELAVIFLIFTSMAWNMAFAVYEAVKAIPKEFLEMANDIGMSSLSKVRHIYIPASWPKLAYNALVSWDVGLFFLVSSEIITLGNANYAVAHGIGVAIATYAAQGNYVAYTEAVVLLLLVLVITRAVFLRPWALWSEKFKPAEEPRRSRVDPVYKTYALIADKARAKVFSDLELSVVRKVFRPLSPIGLWLRRRFSGKEAFLARFIATLFLLLLLVALARVLIGLAVDWAPLSSLSFWMGLASTEREVVIALAFSFVRVWGIYLVSLVVGVPLAIKSALSEKLYEPVSTITQIASSIPGPVLLPAIVAVLVSFPLKGELVAATIIFLGSFWYIFFNVLGAARTIPKTLVEASELYQISGWRRWADIYIPSVMPSIVTGSITFIGGAWNTLMVAEYFSVSSSSGSVVLTQVRYGIGRLLDIATYTGNLQLMSLSILSMSLLIVVVNLTFWRWAYNYTTKRFGYNV